jgi:phosphatidylinositol alpha-mannosyltransferase
MKIGLVLPYSIARGGGVQEILKAMQSELEARGHEAYIITPRPRGFTETPHPNTLLVGTSTDFNTPMNTTAQVSAGLNEDIDRILSEHEFDVLHFHEPWIPVLSRQILTRSQTVNVATFHAAVPDTIVSRTVVKVVTPYTKSLLKYIDSYTAVSEPAAEYIRSLTDEDVAIIPNERSLAQFTPPARHADGKKQKTIFYVGRLEGRKGVNYLLRAFQLLEKQDPNISLVIAGDGSDREKLEILADDLRLKNAKFVGYISDAEKLKYLRTADLFCAPSLYGESFGVVLLEAMACQLVTVAGDNPGYESVMKGLGVISLINPRHPEEFARRLGLLLHESDLRKLWRAWAKQEVVQYDYPNIISRYEDVYAEARHKRA